MAIYDRFGTPVEITQVVEGALNVGVVYRDDGSPGVLPITSLKADGGLNEINDALLASGGTGHPAISNAPKGGIGVAVVILRRAEGGGILYEFKDEADRNTLNFILDRCWWTSSNLENFARLHQAGIKVRMFTKEREGMPEVSQAECAHDGLTTVRIVGEVNGESEMVSCDVCPECGQVTLTDFTPSCDYDAPGGNRVGL